MLSATPRVHAQLLVMLLSVPLRLLLDFFFPIIVEHLYMWPCVGALHVWFLGYGRRGDPEKMFHSRFLDLRVEVCTEAASGASETAPPRRARRFVHLLPQFSDNYAYLVVDAVGIPPRDAGSGQDAGADAEPGPQTTLYFAVLVDPADSVALEAALDEVNRFYYDGQMKLEMVLTTHKHWYHSTACLSHCSCPAMLLRSLAASLSKSRAGDTCAA